MPCQFFMKCDKIYKIKIIKKLQIKSRKLHRRILKRVLSSGIYQCIISTETKSKYYLGVRKVAASDDTKTRIIYATMKAVRQYGLEGVRIQNVSELAGISPGALYRHFDSKEQLLVECFTHIDRQAAAIFDHLKFNPLTMLTNPMGAVKSLWLPYFRFWVAHPDETIFYHRFRDSAFFPEYDRTRSVTYFDSFVEIVRIFRRVFPSLVKMNQDLLWLHVLTSTVMYAKYVVEGTLPNNQETEETVFQLLTTGLSGYLKPEKSKKGKKRC